MLKLSDGRPMTKTIKDMYFDWMVRKVRGESRRKVLMVLNNISFTYILPLDGNRYEDGISLRYRFGREAHIAEAIIADEIDYTSCSVLEMMIALAIRCEEDYMSDPSYGDRSYIWFNDMLKSMGIDRMRDDVFQQPYIVDCVYRFLNRTYAPNGKGGLFTVDRPGIDMRREEIWKQAMWHLTSLYNYS